MDKKPDLITCTQCDSDFGVVTGVKQCRLSFKKKKKRYEMTLGKHMCLETIFLENGEKITHKQVVDKLNQLTELVEELEKYKQPHCKKCEHYSCDAWDHYCNSENSLLGSDTYNPFPLDWDWVEGARNCKSYKDTMKFK